MVPQRVGYLIDWIVTAGVATVLVEKSRTRLKKIDQEKQKLVESWGDEVTGKIKLDEFGFAVEKSRYDDDEE